MTELTLLAAAATATGAPTRLDPVELFLQADIVVQAVILGLVLASIWVWAIIISFSLRMGGVRRRSKAYEDEFWEVEDFAAFNKRQAKKNIPSARVAAAGLNEWRRSTGGAKVVDRDGTRERLAATMASQVAQESDELSDRLNFLATTGSVAPFVGLFGTVWGIMNSFFQIGVQESSSLAVVAPGISEALFATAIGLFAAIPAVIAYNRFSHSVNGYEANLQRFADRFGASLSRQLESM
ncbi:MAG: protein TolQ [Alteripontixanthobacter sp.]